MDESLVGAVMARRDRIIKLSDLSNARRLIICMVLPLAIGSIALIIYALWLGA